MKSVKYKGKVLSDGHLSLPKEIRKLLNLNTKDTLEIVISKTTKEKEFLKKKRCKKSIFELQFCSPDLLNKIKKNYGSLDPIEIIYPNRR